MQMSRITRIALISTLVAATSAAAFAMEAETTTTLNIRTGPGSAYVVLDTLGAGEVVQVDECQSNGWCMIYHDGPDGWVSSRYLTPVDYEPSQPYTPAPVQHDDPSNDIAAAATFAAVLGIGALIIGSAIHDNDHHNPPSNARACPPGMIWTVPAHGCVPVNSPRPHH